MLEPLLPKDTGVFKGPEYQRHCSYCNFNVSYFNKLYFIKLFILFLEIFYWLGLNCRTGWEY